MRNRIITIVVITVLALLFLSLSESDLAVEGRTFLRALLRAIF
ncbi:hypothetical protein [Paramixta manurensis]